MLLPGKERSMSQCVAVADERLPHRGKGQQGPSVQGPLVWDHFLDIFEQCYPNFLEGERKRVKQPSWERRAPCPSGFCVDGRLPRQGKQ